MSKKTRLTNEMICSALLEKGTIKETAKALNVSERTIYNHMIEKEFKVLYGFAQTDILNNAIYRIQNNLQSAIDTIIDIMTDKEIDPKTRLKGAEMIIENNIRLVEIKDGKQYQAIQNMYDSAFEFVDFDRVKTFE